MTRITNVYNSNVNRTTTANEITYVNRNVNGGVTVVSRETFVNSQSVGKNVVTVPAKELASLPASREEKLVASKPPLASMNRQVVALRTPAPMPQSLDLGEAQAVHPSQVQLVRQQSPGRPVPVTILPVHQTQVQEESRSFTPISDGSAHAKASRVWEEQGTPEPPRSAEAQPGNERYAQHSQPSLSAHSTQHSQQPVQSSHSLPKPAAPPQQKHAQEQEPKYSSWHQQKSWSSSSSTSAHK